MKCPEKKERRNSSVTDKSEKKDELFIVHFKVE